MDALLASYRAAAQPTGVPPVIDAEQARAYAAKGTTALVSIMAHHYRQFDLLLDAMVLGPEGRRRFVQQGLPLLVTKDKDEVALLVTGVYCPALARATDSVPLSAHLPLVTRGQLLAGLSQMASSSLPPVITHLGLLVVWPAGSAVAPDGAPVLEAAVLVTPRPVAAQYLRGDLTDQYLIDRSQVYACDEQRTQFKRLEVRLDR
jgi:hypothetical protein